MQVIPPPASDSAPRYPFDKETVIEHQRGDDGPPVTDKIRRNIHVLPFLSPSAMLVFSLVFVAALHASGLLLFTKGFLLTRLALEDINDCTPRSSNGSFDRSCSLPPTHSKLVFLLVDALRADFVFPVPSTSTFTPSSFHHNLIPLPAQLTSENPTHSFLAHFIADAPTTTLQRLKGLTTGSLPTFVDAGSNFGGEQITEDNWLAQAKRAGKRIAMVGDETWLNVFPKGPESVWREEHVWAYDSFNVEDLDTVDRGVVEHLLPLLDDNLAGNGSWDIVIAHALGLDHSGHRFGPNHPEATRKLRETEKLLEEIVARLDEDTLLVVIGDHGMTDQGDHGGDSREEVEAALWIYSKGAAITSPDWFDNAVGSSEHLLSRLVDVSRSALELGDRLEIEWLSKGVEKARAVSQVDLVPTLSLLLGLPVPFGNLGVVIPELFYRLSSFPSGETPDEPKPKRSFFGSSTPSTKASLHTSSPLQTLVQANHLVSAQLSTYFSTYTSSPSGSDLLPSIPELDNLLIAAKSSLQDAGASVSTETRERELVALEKFWTYGRTARERARAIWARFDPWLMCAGLLVWIGSVVVAARLFVETSGGPGARFLIGRGVEGALVASWITIACWLLSAFQFFGGLSSIWIVFILCLGAEVGVLSASFARGRSVLASLTNNPWKSFVSFLPLLGHCALFASNSFTVFEDSSVLFFLSTLLVLTLLRSLSAPEPRLRKRLIRFSLVALVSVRLMAYSTICREEQIPLCHATFHLTAGSYTALGFVGLAFVAAWFLPTVLLALLAQSKSDQDLAPGFLNGGIRFLLLGSVSYWAVDWMIAGLSLGSEGIMVANVVKTGFARIVLVASILFSSLIWFYVPLCIKFDQQPIKDATGAVSRTVVKVIGFANSFGSSYLLFLASIFTLLFLVNPPPAQIVLILHLVTLVCLLEIFDSERDVDHLKATFNSQSIDAFLNNEQPPPPPHSGPTFLQISTLGLLSQLSFFATGHQASFAAIQWSTAFIGFPTLMYPFSPMLVVLNTLGPHLLTALSIPLFVLWTIPPQLKEQPPLPLFRNLLRAGVSYMTYQAVVSLSTALWAAYFRRHLMVWKIFAPRFMVGGIVMLGTDVALIGLGVAWGALVTMGKVRARFGTRFVE